MTATLAKNKMPDSSAAASKVACDHCGLPVPIALYEAAADFQFCCTGCEVAYETIRDCGLDDYYKFRDRLTDVRKSACGAGNTYKSYDTDAFQSRLVSSTEGGYCSIDFRLEGVHCAACVWLVERLPYITEGVVEARLSLGSSRARIVWDPTKISLSTIARQLDRLGYAPHPARDVSAHAAKSNAERGRLIHMAIAGALAGNNMLIAVALYAGVFEGIDPAYARLFRWLSMGIGWLSLTWPGITFFRSAWVALRAKTANLDQPIAMALATGAVAGTINVLLDRGEVYFDSLSTLVFLLLVGRYFQANQQRWAEEAIGLTLSMTPDSCRVVRDGTVYEESSEALEAGDEVEVRPGELIPADGLVTSGSSAMDQSLLTGESRPKAVGIGDPVFAGAQNVTSKLLVRVGAVGDETRIGKIIRLVEDGLADKSPIVQFADRIAGWFVVAMSTIAVANLIGWSVGVGLSAAIDSTIALLIVACPCALGLATPLTMAVAIGNGSRQGMLIKSAAVLERLAGVSPATPGRLFVDKTGTLTSGRLGLECWMGDDRLLPWVAAVEADSPHPIGRALVEAFGPFDQNHLSQIENRSEFHGQGVLASIPLGDLLIGSQQFAESQGIFVGAKIADGIEQAEEHQHTVVIVAIDGHAIGVVALSDELHVDSQEQITWLRRSGWRTEILSGDAAGPVLQVAAGVGLSDEAAHATVSPEGKLQRIRDVTADVNHPTVMMVGDGVNDAAALAAADVGVAVDGGAEASLAAADVYLLEHGIGKLTELVRLGSDTMHVIRRNLIISLCYNLVAVALAVGGAITPFIAALLMPLSSLTVLVSAVAFAMPHAGKRSISLR